MEDLAAALDEAGPKLESEELKGAQASQAENLDQAVLLLSKGLLMIWLHDELQPGPLPEGAGSSPASFQCLQRISLKIELVRISS